MSSPGKTAATYVDLKSVPDHLRAEILDGELVTQRRPSAAHALATSSLAGELLPKFHKGKGGPGGWIILFEPELHLGPRPDILVPDIAGWRRESLPEFVDTVHFETAPDWVCETLSPSSAMRDRTIKVDIYAREGVAHVWLLDPRSRTLEVFRLQGDAYLRVAAHSDADTVRAEPFSAVELQLSELWEV